MKRELFKIVSCTECNKPLKADAQTLFCQHCDVRNPVIDGIPRFYETTRENIIEFDEKRIRDPRHWSKWRRKNYSFFEEQTREILSSSLVLDIGAGTSPFSKILDRFNDIKIDFRPYRGIDLLTDLNKKLPFSDESFDLIIMSNLLEHIPEPQKLLDECYRILKEDGKIIMTIPFIIKIHQAPYDFLRYTEYMLERMLFLAGYRRVTIKKIGNMFDVNQVVFAQICRKLMENSGDNRFKKLAVKIYRYLFLYSLRAMIAITDHSENNQEDILGYPHGYGCVAQKME